LMFIGLFIVGMAYIVYWLSQRYAFFAAVEGVGTAVQIFRR